MVAIAATQRLDILSAFGMSPGATLSGLAFGDRFAEGSGEIIDTRDA